MKQSIAQRMQARKDSHNMENEALNNNEAVVRVALNDTRIKVEVGEDKLIRAYVNGDRQLIVLAVKATGMYIAEIWAPNYDGEMVVESFTEHKRIASELDAFLAESITNFAKCEPVKAEKPKKTTRKRNNDKAKSEASKKLVAMAKAYSANVPERKYADSCIKINALG